MPLLDGPSLGGNARHVLRQYAEESALARERTTNAAGNEEFGGGCLRGRYNNLRETVQPTPSIVVVPSLINAGGLFVQRPVCRTNYLVNNAMLGATGSVLPTAWASGAIPAGFTFSIGASGQATANDGTLVNYVDVSVSGTATASGTFNLFFSAATGAVTATTGQTFTLSAYATCISGDITTPATVLQLQEVSGSTFQAGTSTNIALASGAPLQRVSAVRTFNQSGVTAARGRIGHPIVSGTTYSYTIRIASPQLERLGVATPMIATSTGAVTRLNESTNVVGLPPDFTVSRNTTATRVDSSGLIASVASGLLRLDYPVTGGCPAALIEPAATNVVVQSQNWLASGWRSDASSNVTTATGTTGTLDPLGTNTANAISPTSGNVGHLKVSNDGLINFTSGTIHTFSGFFKQGTGSAGRYVQVTPPIATFTQGFYANFDLQLGTIAATGSVSADSNRAASIENYGNGWYRCRVTATCNVTTTSVGFVANLITASGDTRGPSFAGSTTDILYGWGAQLETGSVATTYIPTTTGAVSRAAEAISASGALVSSLIGQTEGTIYAEVDVRNLGLIASLINIQTTAYTSGAVRIETTASNQLRIQIRDASGNSRLDNTISSPTLSSGINKIAVGYSSDASGVITALNGTIINTTTVSASFGSLGATKVYLGTREQAGAYDLFLNNRIRAAALYTTRLTDAQLAELTRL